MIVDLGRDVEVDDGEGGKKVVSSLEVGRKRIESVEGGCEVSFFAFVSCSVRDGMMVPGRESREPSSRVDQRNLDDEG